ncbi:MAG: carbohydrate kinase, partial [Flavobacteriaceae bacterium]
MYFLGIDIGSSSVKVALVDAQTGEKHTLVQVPEQEMSMQSLHKGWAEQDPDAWWQLVCEGIGKIRASTEVTQEQVRGIGISYQMHGLVVVDENGLPLRPSIIWCDSRAV